MPALRVMSSVALAPNRHVHVISAPDGRSFLLGATPNQVNLIAELGEIPVGTEDLSESPFAGWLRTALKRSS
jgi:flagellar biogenesis protein FliO